MSESVRQVFAKQLTVCPQMSIEKALIITQKFPNMKSLWDLYINNNKKSVTERVDPKLLLNKEISQIPPSLSAQVSLCLSVKQQHVLERHNDSRSANIIKNKRSAIKNPIIIGVFSDFFTSSTSFPLAIFMD